VLRLRPLAPADLAAVLQTHSAVDADSALRYACLSGGRPGLALTYLQTPDLLAERTQWLDNLVDCLPANRLTRFKLAEVYSKDKDTLRQILAAWLVYWRDIMLAAAGANTPLTNVDRQEEIRALAARCGFTQACNMVQRLDTTLENLDANLNARLLLEVLLLDMPYLN
jgi:DNA polymerase-3 subunit delta'